MNFSSVQAMPDHKRFVKKRSKIPDKGHQFLYFFLWQKNTPCASNRQITSNLKEIRSRKQTNATKTMTFGVNLSV